MFKIGDHVKTLSGQVGRIEEITRLDCLQECAPEDEGDLPYFYCLSDDDYAFYVCEYECELLEPKSAVE